MARIVLTTFGSHGDLNPFLAIGLGLKRRGHDAVLAAAEGYRADAERLGLGFAPVRPDLDKSDLETFRRALDPKRGSEVVVRELMMPKVRESYEDLDKATAGCDLLVTHVLTYAGPVLAQKKGLKWLSTSLQPLAFFSSYDPPVVPPAPWLSVLRPLGPGFHRLMLGAMKRVSYPWGDEVRALRRSLGMDDGLDPIFEGQYSPHGTLALYSSLFGPAQPDWPAGVVHCGFPFHDEDLGGKGLDPELVGFLNEGPAPVAFTLGSAAVMIAGDFYERAAEFTKALGVRAVLLAGEAAVSLPRSKSVFPAASAPYHTLFPRCAAIVHSGGIGTTGQALRSGVPQLVVPVAHDQFDNAARVARLGCGLWSSRQRLSSDLARLLADRLAHHRAAAVGKAVRTENAVKTACDAIERALT
ncbi:MAG: glycosyltransferase [Elusimicrobiota bacterium]|nr:MAG: glycosyltransferase [Elusimicrobiota bacterium]